MKKSRLALLSLLTGMSLVSCSSKSIKVNPDKEEYTVGICQLVTHPALDAATKGFKTALTEYLIDKGRLVQFDEQNAAGDSSTCTTIVNKFVSHDVDLIMANATSPLQAAANSTLSIPILGTSITDYGTALNCEVKDGIVGGNISGTSDLAPLDTQAQMMCDLFPNATRVGVIYCSSEANSKFQLDQMKKFLEQGGKQVTAYPFVDSNDLAAIVTNACNNSDLIYLPTDNTVASNTTLIDSIARPAKTPIFAGEQGIMDVCGCFTLSISYENIGKVTGTMAGKILLGELDITKAPIAYDTEPVKLFNREICEELSITVPAGYIEA